MRRCLVDDRATQQRSAVALLSQAEPIEPVGPAGFEVSCESDFLTSSFVALHASNVESPGVITPHQMW
jgi:hypothetical protein